MKLEIDSSKIFPLRALHHLATADLEGNAPSFPYVGSAAMTEHCPPVHWFQKVKQNLSICVNLRPSADKAMRILDILAPLRVRETQSAVSLSNKSIFTHPSLRAFCGQLTPNF